MNDAAVFCRIDYIKLQEVSSRLWHINVRVKIRLDISM
jgi:hypothetical protein